MTGNPVISMYTEMTPNPATVKFVANKYFYRGKRIDFADEASARPFPLAQEFFTKISGQRTYLILRFI